MTPHVAMPGGWELVLILLNFLVPVLVIAGVVLLVRRAGRSRRDHVEDLQR